MFHMRNKLCHGFLKLKACYNLGSSPHQNPNKILINRARDALDLNFNDYRNALKSKTTWEVFRGSLVFSLCSIQPLVANNMEIMNTCKRIFGNTLFGWLMKMTFYGHFVVGEDAKTIKPKLEKLMSFGVFPILDYSVEEDVAKKKTLPKTDMDRLYKVNSARTYFYINEATCERNMETFLKCLEMVAPYGEGYAAIKLTALGRPSLLLQISEVITKTRRFMEELVGKKGSVIRQNVSRGDVIRRLNEFGVKEKEKIDDFLSRITEDKNGIINLFPWSGIINANQKLTSAFLIPDLTSGQLVNLISQLSDEEEEKFRNLVRRVSTLASAAEQLGVSVMVDAEQSYFQAAISRLTLELMRKYNSKRPVILNTYQCYMKNSLAELKADLEQSERQNFYFGAKLVRGAYLEQERERAATLGNKEGETYGMLIKQYTMIRIKRKNCAGQKELTLPLFKLNWQDKGICIDSIIDYTNFCLRNEVYQDHSEPKYPDPTNESYEDTTEMYHEALYECMERVKACKVRGDDPRRYTVVVASHNEDTVRFAIEEMIRVQIEPEEGVISFAQLYGMCDFISYPLGQSGYYVYKYMPYGPVNEVLPYLSRRVQENSGLLLKAQKERKMFSKELLRRIISLQFFQKPVGRYEAPQSKRKKHK